MNHPNLSIGFLLTSAIAALLCPTAAAARPLLRIAFIDPLSGLFASAGEFRLQYFRHGVETINARGAVLADTLRARPRQMIVPFDNRAQTREPPAQLQRVIDHVIRAVVRGRSSAALALSDAIARYNRREPAR